MLELNLKADLREGRGKNYNTRLRDKGLLPAIIYGKGIEGLAIQLEAKEIEKLFASGAGRNAIINITVSGSRKKNKVMIKEVQKDPVKGFLKHIDFYHVNLKEKIDTVVPIHLIGESEGVRKGGILQHGIREIEVQCLPTEVPEQIEIEISALEIGQNVTVADLKVPDELHIVTDPSTVVASVLAPHMEEEPEEAKAPTAEETPAKEEENKEE